MIVVIDKKVVKHLVETGDGLLEIPVRVSYEYSLENQRFVDGTMKSDYLYNREAVKRHFPRLDDERLDRDISATVDQSLEEGLRYQGHIEGSVALYPHEAEPEIEANVQETPKIILPGES
ncbi:MAG TPA: hypothetical protein VJ998_05575 [Pseudomonadales bacterium]|nr:hypothetical protein [Pseudomonadales bacterium]